MSILILAEKPSQAKAYADAFNNISRKDGYIEVNDNRFFYGKAYISWGFGHLVELVEPEKYKKEWGEWSLNALPIIPKHFKFQVAKDKKKQFNTVKKLLDQATEIIVATDSDREGENIARSIIDLAGASSKPTKRLWINSLEIAEIQKGFKSLKNGLDYIPLYEEAKTRQIADWIVGMNASRLYTLLIQSKGGQGAYSVGRVQSPTLFLINKREQEIKNFVPKPFYELVANVTVKKGNFVAKHKEKFDQKKQVAEILQKHNIADSKQNGLIKHVEKENKKSNSPKLHSLSTLQTKMNQKWKYSPSDVLKIVQSLYEKKLLSYPRTDTQYITDNEFEYLKQNLDQYKETLGITFDVVYPNARKRYVNNEKVQEHYSIIPTKQVSKLDALDEKERNVYKEVLATTLAMFMGDYQYEQTKIIVDINGLDFHATGNVEIDKGWKVLFTNEKEENKETIILPSVSPNEGCNSILNTKEGITKPPKPYTEGGLINMMKHAGKEIEDDEAKEKLKEVEGIGTEATRSGIIETLKRQKYIEVKKNIVSVTKKGEILCDAINGTLLSSPEMTAKWEQYLSKIGNRQGSQQKFLDNIERFILSLIEKAPNDIEKVEKNLTSLSTVEKIGECPVCDSGTISDKGKFYGCSGYANGCKFTIPKTFLGKAISKSNAEKLLQGKSTSLLKGFKSKKGKNFDASLKLDDGNGKIQFEFPKK